MAYTEYEQTVRLECLRLANSISNVSSSEVIKAADEFAKFVLTDTDATEKEN